MIIKKYLIFTSKQLNFGLVKKIPIVFSVLVRIILFDRIRMKSFLNFIHQDEKFLMYAGNFSDFDYTRVNFHLFFFYFFLHLIKFFD